MKTWQPIDTAPKDGTRILLYDQTRDVVVSGCWHCEPEFNTHDGYEPAWSWWVSDDEVILWDCDSAPSHWMQLDPLPGKTA